jgi:hypothetical protein
MSQYNRHAVVPIPQVMALIKENYNTANAKAMVEGFEVGVSSLRLKTFYRFRGKMCCLGCGLKASFFSVDSFKNGSQNSHHLNLYAQNGETEVLMTHDHRIARGLGGADNLSNTSLMCSPCNNKKSKAETSLSNERRFIDTHVKDPAKKAQMDEAWHKKVAEYKERWAHLTI